METSGLQRVKRSEYKVTVGDQEKVESFAEINTSFSTWSESAKAGHPKYCKCVRCQLCGDDDGWVSKGPIDRFGRMEHPVGCLCEEHNENDRA